MLAVSGKLKQFLTFGIATLGTFGSLLSQPCLAPTQQTSFLVPDSIRQDSAFISWIPGNGDGRAIFIQQQAGFISPAAGTIPTPSTTYVGGQQCVYDGTGAGPVWISGLQPNTIYHVAGFEYCLPDRTYQDTAALLNPSSFITSPTPCTLATVQASNIGTVQVSTTSVSFYWSVGNGSGRAVFLSDGAPAPPPQNGTQPLADTAFSSGSQCVFWGPGAPTLHVTGLSPGTTYSIRIFEYCGNSPTYLTDTGLGNPYSFTTPADSTINPCDPPLNGIQGLTAVWLGGDSIQVDWQSPSSDGQVVFVGSSSPILPPVNGQSPPTSSTQYQGHPTVLYFGSLSGPMQMTGLSPGTYYVAGYAYCLPDFMYDLEGLQSNPISVTVGTQGLDSKQPNAPWIRNPVIDPNWMIHLPESWNSEFLSLQLHSISGHEIPARFESVEDGLRWNGPPLSAGVYVLHWNSPFGTSGNVRVVLPSF